MKKVKWKPETEDQDYPSAASFLSLLCSPSQVEKMIPLFHRAAVVEIKAKDVIRASRLPVLAKSNFHVAKDMKRIADGYHRACAVYWNSEGDFIQARIIDWKL